MRFQSLFGAACLVAVVGSVALAEPASPANDPGPSATQLRPASRPGEFGRPPIGEFGRLRAGFQPSDEQRQAAEAFIGLHSPNHFKMYQDMPERMHFRMQGAIVQGFLDLQAVQMADPDLYKMKIEQIELQDKIFGIAANRADGKLDRKSLHEQIRPLEKRVIELRRAEANHRIERMEAAIQNEKDRVKNLDQIAANGIDTLIDQEVDHGTSNAPFMLGPFRGGPGPGAFRAISPPTTAPSTPDQR